MPGGHYLDLVPSLNSTEAIPTIVTTTPGAGHSPYLQPQTFARYKSTSHPNSPTAILLPAFGQLYFSSRLLPLMPTPLTPIGADCRIVAYSRKETRQMLVYNFTLMGNAISYLLWRAANVNLRRAPLAHELPSGYNVPPYRIEQFKAHLALLDRPPNGGLDYIDAETAEIIFRTLHGKHNEILDGILKDPDQKRREERMLEAHELMRQWLVIDKAIRDTNSDALLYERDQASGRELRRSAMLASVTQVCAQVKLGR